jgi:hypothetical protein
MRAGSYMPPEMPGYGVKFTDAAIEHFSFPRPEA